MRGQVIDDNNRLVLLVHDWASARSRYDSAESGWPPVLRVSRWNRCFLPLLLCIPTLSDIVILSKLLPQRLLIIVVVL